MLGSFGVYEVNFAHKGSVNTLDTQLRALIIVLRILTFENFLLVAYLAVVNQRAA